MDDKTYLKELETAFDEDIYNMLYNMDYDYSGFMNHAHKLSKDDFCKWLVEVCNSAKGINLKEGYVPQIIYIIYYENNPVGVIKLRYRLNESLKKSGGHISIAVDKNYVGKGIGPTAIAKAVEILNSKYNVHDILITIRESNIPSRKMAEKCGFILEKVENGMCSYWKR